MKILIPIVDNVKRMQSALEKEGISARDIHLTIGKPGNETKIKILKFQENSHKPSLLQELEQFYNVTPCNEKCNFSFYLSVSQY